MPNTTRWLAMQINDFFRESDRVIDEAIREKDSDRLFAFIKEHVEAFPAPSRYIYEKIFEKETDICSRYTDFTLTALKTGAEASVPVEKHRQDHRRKQEEYPKKLNAYNLQKEAHEKDPLNHPEKPKEPDKIWPFYAEYYNKIIRAELKKKGIDLRGDWKTVIAEQGYLFIQDTKKANAVRSMMFDLAFALEWSVHDLQNILQKILLQSAFNPKNPVEAVYWYCLENKISYTEMRSAYLEYIETEAFRTKYDPGYVPSSAASRDTVQFESQLEQIFEKEKEDLFSYLWVLKYAGVSKTRRTPAAVYWENFRCFPKKVWMGDIPAARHSVSEEELRQLGILRKDEKIGEGASLNSLEEVFAAIMAENPERIRRGSEDDRIDNLIVKGKNRNKEPEVKEKPLPYSEDEYQAVLSLIMEKSRRNYFAVSKAKGEVLLPADTLKKIFGGLDYTGLVVENRKSGRAPLSRTDILATVFIGFFSDLFELYPERNNHRRDRLSLFRRLVNDDLAECGFYKLYPKSPFDMFIVLCFWQEDPLAYFMASWEAARNA